MSSRATSSRRRRTSAFTLVELLVVVAIIALLLTMLVPSLYRARELARRAACASNLSGMAKPFHLYAGQNRSMLPLQRMATANPALFPGSWLWDVPHLTVDTLIENGVERPFFYCPSGLYQDDNKHWWFHPHFKVLGYWFLMKRDGGNFPGLKDRKYLRHLQEDYPLTTTVDGVTTTKMLGPGDLELSTDATISVLLTPTLDHYGYVKGGSSIPHRTSHMDGPNEPAGGNILFLDGHVTWRSFGEMSRHSVDGYSPRHWW